MDQQQAACYIPGTKKSQIPHYQIDTVCSGEREDENKDTIVPTDNTEVDTFINENCTKYMEMAKEISKQSSDPSTKVGVVICSRDERLIGQGINRMPADCEGLPWTKNEDHSVKIPNIETKYPFVLHGGEAAVFDALMKKETTRGCIAFTTLYPGGRDARAFIEAGITDVVYEDDKYFSCPSGKATRRMRESMNTPIKFWKFEQKNSP